MEHQHHRNQRAPSNQRTPLDLGLYLHGFPLHRPATAKTDPVTSAQRPEESVEADGAETANLMKEDVEEDAEEGEADDQSETAGQDEEPTAPADQKWPGRPVILTPSVLPPTV